MFEQYIFVPVIISILLLLHGFFTARKVLSYPSGTQKMIEISNLFAAGSDAYLKRQFKSISLAVGLIFILLILAFGLDSALAFLLGAAFSGLVGYFGMYVAVRSNVKAAKAAEDSLGKSLKVAFDGGLINGVALVSFGLLGISLIFLYLITLYPNLAEKEVFNILTSKLVILLSSFGLGANLLALFMRVGGGIYTKAADVGADLVGKIESNIPENDPRNPAVIADNVGDNVGDCAGMASDVFESYVVSVIAAILIGASLGIVGIIFPLLLYSVGAIASILGTLFVKLKSEKEHPINALFRGFYVSAIFGALLGLVVSYFVLGQSWFNPFLSFLIGLISVGLIAFITDYFTNENYPPVKEIYNSSHTGAATNIITGIGIGLKSSVAMAVLISVAIYLGFLLNGFYGIALVGIGILSLTGFLMAMDTFGPISDNAGGISEMANMPKLAQERLAKLDALGNTTKALTKGFAVGSAAIAAISLFSTFTTQASITGVNVSLPNVFIGLILGAALPFLFAALTMLSVGKAASEIVREVREQFKDGLILKGKKNPDYTRCIDISTKAAISELLTPALLALLTPIAIGALLGLEALGGFIIGAISAGFLLAVFMTTTGAAWDNAKKFIESQNKKGTDLHKAAVVGDTVGDPFKDTSGPAINPLLKVINIVSILIAGILAGKGLGLI